MLNEELRTRTRSKSACAYEFITVISECKHNVRECVYVPAHVCIRACTRIIYESSIFVLCSAFTCARHSASAIQYCTGVSDLETTEQRISVRVFGSPHRPAVLPRSQRPQRQGYLQLPPASLQGACGAIRWKRRKARGAYNVSLTALERRSGRKGGGGGRKVKWVTRGA